MRSKVYQRRFAIGTLLDELYSNAYVYVLPSEIEGLPHALLEGMSDAPVMRHAHGWELAEVPDGFGLYSSTDMCTIQMIIHDDLPVIGTQFHPEYWTDEHPEGKRLIENFCRRAELIL